MAESLNQLTKPNIATHIRNIQKDTPYRILSAIQVETRYDKRSIKLELEGGLFVFLPSRISKKMQEKEMMLLQSGAISLIYVGEIACGGKSMADIKFV